MLINADSGKRNFMGKPQRIFSPFQGGMECRWSTLVNSLNPPSIDLRSPHRIWYLSTRKPVGICVGTLTHTRTKASPVSFQTNFDNIFFVDLELGGLRHCCDVCLGVGWTLAPHSHPCSSKSSSYPLGSEWARGTASGSHQFILICISLTSRGTQRLLTRCTEQEVLASALMDIRTLFILTIFIFTVFAIMAQVTPRLFQTSSWFSRVDKLHTFTIK